MRKLIITLMLLLSVSVMAEKIEFFGNYHSDSRKEKAEDRKGFAGGCIYSGKFSDGKLVKVYTKNACPVLRGKERIGGAFSCEVTCNQCENGRKQEYLMYEGTCEVK
jgi:hypothetical protein